MTDYRAILKIVGLALIAFGLADIAVMMYSMSHNQSYSSSFNVFAVTAGIFLIRGSLGATRVVTWLSAFTLTVFVGATIVIFSRLPIGLFLTQARLNPASSLALWLMPAVTFVLLCWTYRQLRSAPVLGALRADGHSTAIPKLAIGLGIALVTCLAVMLNMTLNSAAGVKAIESARQKLGPGYHYGIQSIQWSGDHRSIVVARLQRQRDQVRPDRVGRMRMKRAALTFIGLLATSSSHAGLLSRAKSEAHRAGGARSEGMGTGMCVPAKRGIGKNKDWCRLCEVDDTKPNATDAKPASGCR